MVRVVRYVRNYSMKDIEIKKTDKIFEFWQLAYKLYKQIPETDEEWDQTVAKYSDLIKQYNYDQFVTDMLIAILQENGRRAKALKEAKA